MSNEKGIRSVIDEALKQNTAIGTTITPEEYYQREMERQYMMHQWSKLNPNMIMPSSSPSLFDEWKKLQGQIVPKPPTLLEAVLAGQVAKDPNPGTRKAEKIVIEIDKIDNGYIITAYSQTLAANGMASVISRSFLEDVTELGKVAIAAVAAADLSK